MGFKNPIGGRGNDLNSLAGQTTLTPDSSTTTYTVETHISLMKGCIQQQHNNMSTMKDMNNYLMKKLGDGYVLGDHPTDPQNMQALRLSEPPRLEHPRTGLGVLRCKPWMER